MMTLDARLLRELRAAAVHLLPGDVANSVGVPLPEIESALTRLSGAGFDIESRPGLGCRLLASPDRLIADDLLSRIGECELAREILVFEETGSTNDIAMRLGREGHAGGLLVFAEKQTAGRGRFGRRWESAPREGLWFSLLLRPAIPVSRWARLTTWAGVCTAAAIEGLTGLPARVKWPNDVQMCGKKIAGILTECSSGSDGSLFAVVGIGLNVNQEAMPPELADRAASLRQLTGRILDRAVIASALIRELTTRLPEVDVAFDRILAEAARRSAILGDWIQLDASGSMLEGRAESLDAEGNLLLRRTDGGLHTVSAGEVTSQTSRFVPDRK
jgi:BirA family biotin operon repressor/biotin-[acetyl-CoA-carboxylase] ligase